MTRENKLALVVGFALILFVGILISDHFSIARQQQGADMSGKLAVRDPLSDPRGRDSFIDMNPPEPAVGATVMSGDPKPSPPNPIIDHSRPEQRTDISKGGLPSYGPNSPDASDEIRMHPDVRPIGEPMFAKGPEIAEPTNLEPVVKSDVRYHEVKPKDSFYSICRQYYGDTSLVDALATYNKLDDPASLRVGCRLMIPPPEQIGGKPAAVAKTPAKTPKTPAAETPATTTTPTPPSLRVVQVPDAAKPPKAGTSTGTMVAQTYVVKPGDSLTGIAQKCLGSKSKWRRLADLNSGVIDDEDNLRVGTVLRLQ